MNSNRVSAALLLLFCLAGGLSAQKTVPCKLIEKGAVLEKLAGGFSFTEGPAADKDGNVFFTDQPNNRILKWSTDGGLSTFREPSGRSNGMFFGKDGYLYTCADENNEIWKIGTDGKEQTVTALFKGKKLNGPNDLWVTLDGDIYFTDPFYRRPWWKHSDMPQDIQAVYYLPAGKSEAVRVADDLRKPNGIVGTPDGKLLYIADIEANKTWVYTINADGSLGNKKLFCDMGSDGMTIDVKGNLYLTGNGVTIFNSSGEKLCNIPVPEKWTANVCFGNKDRKTLYITASTGFYSIRMKNRGAW